MLAKHGTAYGAYLLARAARLRASSDVTAWVEAAKEPAVFLTHAINLDAVAHLLLDLGLARIHSGGRILLTSRLAAMSHQFNRPTKRGLACLLLASRPPDWLHFIVSAGAVSREYIPEKDLADLGWLEGDLDDVLLDAHDDIAHETAAPLRDAIGYAAELAVIDALRLDGKEVTHVAQISDRYGYDIEVHGPPRDRIEVKAASPSTKGRFHLSRNEFDKSVAYCDQWRLVQVVFAETAFKAERIDHSQVEAIIELAPGALSMIIPPDTCGFVWTESALLKPPATCWHPSKLVLDPRFTVPGFAELGAQLRSPGGTSGRASTGKPGHGDLRCRWGP